jgi:hypothetical protein
MVTTVQSEENNVQKNLNKRWVYDKLTFGQPQSSMIVDKLMSAVSKERIQIQNPSK